MGFQFCKKISKKCLHLGKMSMTISETPFLFSQIIVYNGNNYILFIQVANTINDISIIRILVLFHTVRFIINVLFVRRRFIHHVVTQNGLLEKL